MDTPQLLESQHLIRFPDCDPFNHLNNARYLDYFINAREDQIWEAYQINIYHLAKVEGKSWVVGSNQIAYLKPAMLMETVTIQTQLVEHSSTDLLVEMRMYDQSKKQLKAVLWSRFVHYNLKTMGRDEHGSDFMELFAKAELPVTQKSFETRVMALRQEAQAQKA